MNLPAGPIQYLQPEAIVRLKNLSLAARLVVEGLFAGQHRSPHKGYSVEFAEHRQYTPGQDLRHLDWKILAKRDKLYVRQYEEQTSLRAYIVVDASASMQYKHASGVTKFEYACCCAASLAYLMQMQRDAFGLIAAVGNQTIRIPPRQGQSHLVTILQSLESIEPQGQVDLPTLFHDLAQQSQRRALVVVLSDFFGQTPVEKLLDAVGHLRHKKHEVVLMQTLDNAELEFPFDTATEIEDMETGLRIAADGQALKQAYLSKLKTYLHLLKTGCLNQGAGYALANTRQPFEVFLSMYLSRRQQGLA